MLNLLPQAYNIYINYSMGEGLKILEGVFYCIGINYKTAKEDLRGVYSLSLEQQMELLSIYKREGIKVALVISTCNRTEIYAVAEHPFKIIKHFISQTGGDMQAFEKVAYIYKGREAVDHIFRVGTGLDSQILGDFEITSQLKSGFKLSKEEDLCDAFLERLFNAVIQASKRIKNETELSSGAASVAFAAVQYVLGSLGEASQSKNILLFGTGKIGRNTCENLMKHVNQDHITLVNRTKEKAQILASKFQVRTKPIEDLSEQLDRADIVIVATGAKQPTIRRKHFLRDKPLLILDLSVPKNVSEDVNQLFGAKVVHVDELSRITDETLERRKNSIPAAEAIIEELKKDFNEWLTQRKLVPSIKALKDKLNHLKEAEIQFQSKRIKNFQLDQAEIISDRFIQKITTYFANYLKEEGNTDTGLRAIQQMFQLESEEK